MVESRGSSVDVHDLVAQLKEARSIERLREEVSKVVVGVDVGHDQLASLHHVAHVEVTALDVLGAVVVLGVVGKVARSAVVRA